MAENTSNNAERVPGRKMSKSEFMSRYINDMYDKRLRERRNEADIYLIETARRQKVISEKKKRRGVLKYEY